MERVIRHHPVFEAGCLDGLYRERMTTGYRVVVKKGSKTLLTKTVPGSKLERVVKQLADGVDRVSISAVNSKGTGPAVSTTFRVKK